MPHPSRHTAKRRLLTAAAVLLAVLLAAGAAGYGLFTGSITDRDSVVCIPENTSFEALCDTLSAEGRITRPGRFRIVARAMGADRKIRSGRYELHAGMSAHRIVSMLRSGSQTPLRVTFNNIRTMSQLASVLGRQLRADSAAFAAMLLDDSVAARYGFRPEEFIGMFIPDTYEVYWTVSPDAFAERMNREYRRFWSGTRQERLRRTGLTEKEVAILASIIDEETNRTDEMPVMAGVYINRLHRGIPLQADPTVRYAIGDFTLKRILNRHLKVDSPYNTYQHAGLPPGPIRMPSVAAIDAVLGYAEHDYLYFCARPDFSGYHAFARTLAEHNRNARAYAAALDRRGIR